MTWIRLDEGFPEHPKVLAAGDEAAWLFVCALGYCNRHLTDGAVPAAAVNRLTGFRAPGRLAARLVEVGLFEISDNGFVVHDFLDYQPSRASIESERAGARERMRSVRQRSKGVRPNETETSPSPSPSRSDTESSSSSQKRSSNGAAPVDDDDGRIDRAITLHARWAAQTADNPKSYARTVAANDRRESIADLRACLKADPAMTAERLAQGVFQMSEVDVARAVRLSS